MTNGSSNNPRPSSLQDGAAAASDRRRVGAYVPAASVAAILGVSTETLYAWLQVGRGLGVRFDLLSPLLPGAYAELAAGGSPTAPFSRERLVFTPSGVEPVETDDPDEQARIDRHLEAVTLAALTGDDRPLRRFRTLAVRGVPFASDVEQLTVWATTTAGRGEGAS